MISIVFISIILDYVYSYDPIQINQTSSCQEYAIEQIIGQENQRFTNLMMYTNSDQIYVNEKGCDKTVDQCEMRKLNCLVSKEVIKLFIQCQSECSFTLYIINMEELNIAINKNKEIFNNYKNETIEFQNTYNFYQYYLINVPYLNSYINFVVLNWQQNTSYLNYTVKILSHTDLSFTQTQIGSYSLRYQSQQPLIILVEGIQGSVIHSKVRVFDQELKIHLNELIDETVQMGSSNSYLFEFVREKTYQQYKNYTLQFEFNEQFGMAGLYIHQGQFPQLLQGYHWQSDSGTLRIIQIDYEERKNKNISNNEDIYHVTIFGKVLTSYTLRISLKELMQQQITTNSLVQGFLQPQELQIFQHTANTKQVRRYTVDIYGNCTMGYMYCFTSYLKCESKIQQLNLTKQILEKTDDYEINYFPDSNKQIYIQIQYLSKFDENILFLQFVYQFYSLFIKNLNEISEQYQLKIDCQFIAKLAYQGQLVMNNQDMNTTEKYKFEVPKTDNQLEFIEIFIDFLYGQSQFEFYYQQNQKNVINLNKTRNVIPVQNLTNIPYKLDVYCTTHCVYQFYFKLIWKNYKNKTIDSIIQLKASQRVQLFCSNDVYVRFDSLESKVGQQPAIEAEEYLIILKHDGLVGVTLSYKSIQEIDKNNYDQRLQSDSYQMLYIFLKPSQSAWMKLNCSHNQDVEILFSNVFKKQISLLPNYPIQVKQSAKETIFFSLYCTIDAQYQLILHLNNENQFVEFHDITKDVKNLTQGGLFNVSCVTLTDGEHFQFQILSNHTVEYTVQIVYQNSDFYIIDERRNINSHILPFKNKSIQIIYITNTTKEISLFPSNKNKPILVHFQIEQISKEQFYNNFRNLSFENDSQGKIIKSSFNYQIKEQDCSQLCYFYIKISLFKQDQEYALISIFQESKYIKENQFYEFSLLPQNLINLNLLLNSENPNNQNISLYFGYSKFIDAFVDVGCGQNRLQDMSKISLEIQQIFIISNPQQYRCVKFIAQNNNENSETLRVFWTYNNYSLLQPGGDGILHNYFYHPEIQSMIYFKLAFILLYPNRYQFIQVFTNQLQPSYTLDYINIQIYLNVYDEILNYKPIKNQTYQSQIAQVFEFKSDITKQESILVRLQFQEQTQFQLLWGTQNGYVIVKEQCSLIMRGLNQTINFSLGRKSQILLKLLQGEILINDDQNKSQVLIPGQDKKLQIPDQHYKLQIKSSQNSLYQLQINYEHFNLNLDQIYTFISEQKQFQYTCNNPKGQELNLLFEMNHRFLNCSFSLTIKNQLEQVLFLQLTYFDKITVPYGKSLLYLNENCQSTAPYQFYLGLTLKNSLLIDFNRIYSFTYNGNLLLYLYSKAPSILLVDIQQEQGQIRSLVSQKKENIDLGITELSTQSIQNQYKKIITQINEEGFVYILNTCYNKDQLCTYKIKLNYLEDIDMDIRFVKGQSVQINNVLQIKLFEQYQGFTIDNVRIITKSQVINTKYTDIMLYTIRQEDQQILLNISIIINNMKTYLIFEEQCEYRQKEVIDEFDKIGVIVLFLLIVLFVTLFLKRRKRRQNELEFNIIRDATISDK